MKIELKITSGIHRSRKIECPDIPGLRPTQSKQRQAVFNIIGNDISGESFLDLCCGSGIMGFEALSRGADYVYFVDESRKLIKSITFNAEKIGAQTKINARCTSWQDYFKLFKTVKFDFIYFDPPFSTDTFSLKNTYNLCGNFIKDSNILNEKGIFITEYNNNLKPELENEGFVLKKEKNYGTVGISFWQLK